MIHMIYITGDTHRDIIRFKKEHFPANEDDYLIICGDFGMVWKDSRYEHKLRNLLEEKPFTTLFVSGNHENFDLLAKFPIQEWNGGKVQFIKDNIIHLMRGQVFTIGGHTFFTMGGASSHDIADGILDPDAADFEEKKNSLMWKCANYRINHRTWWKEELPSDDEYAEAEKNLNAHGRKIDYIITHCAPDSIEGIVGNSYHHGNHLTGYLETVKQTCSFKKWFFGHYHINKVINDKFVVLYTDTLCYDTLMDAHTYLGTKPLL